MTSWSAGGPAPVAHWEHPGCEWAVFPGGILRWSWGTDLFLCHKRFLHWPVWPRWTRLEVCTWLRSTVKPSWDPSRTTALWMQCTSPDTTHPQTEMIPQGGLNNYFITPVLPHQIIFPNCIAAKSHFLVHGCSAGSFSARSIDSSADDKSSSHPKLSSVATGFWHKTVCILILKRVGILQVLPQFTSCHQDYKQTGASFIFPRRQIQRIKSRKANPAAAQGKIKDYLKIFIKMFWDKQELFDQN